MSATACGCGRRPFGLCAGRARPRETTSATPTKPGTAPWPRTSFGRYSATCKALAHFRDLAGRGISFVTRAKDNIACRVKKRLPRGKDPRVLKDELIVMKGHYARQDYPGVLRRVTARVELDGQERILVFLTNNLEWSGGSVADLYRCRWQIEVFFKQVKQTLQLANFFGQSANAVKWQVWMALLVYVLLRFEAWRSAWTHSFSRLLTLCRAALWLPRDLGDLLERYGTAGGRGGSLTPPRQSELPGFSAYLMGQHV